MGGGLSSDRVQPDEVNTSENLKKSESEETENFQIKNRSSTDVFFLIVFLIFLTALICSLSYCFFYGDIYRVINGYDNCGNICGRDNKNLKNRNDGKKSPQCLGTDKVHEPYHIVLQQQSSKVMNRICTSDCNQYPGYRKFFNRCMPNQSEAVVNKVFSRTGLSNFFTEVSEDFQICWTEICYLCLIALVLSCLLLALFRFLVGFVVWIVLMGSLSACVIATVVLWILWKHSKNYVDDIPDNLVPDVDARKTYTYLVFAILTTIATVIISLIIFVMRKRIELVVQLFEESGKAIAAMPILLFQPILTFLSLGIVVALWFIFSLLIESSGTLSEYRLNVFFYEKDAWMKFTRWYNFIAMLWMVQFIIGCQHMIIAGAVSIWYFKRDKSSLGTPVIQSTGNLIRFHLGSVALGSCLIATVQFIRMLMKLLEKFLRNREGKIVDCLLKCCHCCLYCFEKILKYLTRNAYIEVAIFGLPFCKAGQQAYKLLTANILRVAAINSVGDFVLFLGKVVVVIATVLIGIKILQDKEGLQHMWVPITLSGLFAYFVSHCFMTVYEMVIDTIFLCFCEDCEKNDGENRPYFMSRGLMEFVENSKRALDSKKKSSTVEATIPSISEDVTRNFSG
ncbi:choline transporter-like protein 1 [Diorhabda sublineata]|uniref:choline transporter-like protein 1 n=2 Tax=Diorhabda sublineata TaxID=1163346 RepID=UPI0024E194CF|nr:choline transporter-like protein 1 [Diorhabda sublineata]XP_056632053.1 choline transporter-like protein 1 [Diorhabda sublineata]XP_056632054.1 choline transporter-like protein 1 [Diorhabda sublineata]XP_056632055.1 choline transporter-like protein 1 [Diorhabda sublineata]